MTPHFDGTIHLSDVVLFGSGILAFVRVWLAMRDQVRDHGGKIQTLEKTVEKHDETLGVHDVALARLGVAGAVGRRHRLEGV